MKRDKVIELLVGGLLCLIIIFLAVYNALCNWREFIKINIVGCITLFIAIVLSYFWVQRRNVDNKRKEMLQTIVMRLQEIVVSPSCYYISEKTMPEDLTILKRSINNYVGLIVEYGREVWGENQVDKIKGYAEEYSEVIGNHINDIDYLNKSRLELKRPMQLMETELSKMLLELYR